LHVSLPNLRTSINLSLLVHFCFILMRLVEGEYIYIYVYIKCSTCHLEQEASLPQPQTHLPEPFSLLLLWEILICPISAGFFPFTSSLNVMFHVSVSSFLCPLWMIVTHSHRFNSQFMPWAIDILCMGSSLRAIHYWHKY
jgi:hypothetical protein